MNRVRLAASLLACLAPGAAGLPQDGVVTHGDGSITQTAPDRMVIEQRSGRMAAEFSSFDIAAQERVDVLQPGRDAVFLGRITGNDATAIFGTLSANGSVILVNPRGVVFGPTARVETASLVATSLGVDVDAFMSGALELEFSADVAGRILNQGVLEAASGGGVALVGDEVVNEGLIVAELGRVDLASGSEAVIRFDAEGLVGVAVQGGAIGGSGGADAVRNAGAVEAPGGQIVLTADAARELFSAAVNNTGVLRANAAREVDGEIVLFSTTDTVTSGTLEATSATGTGGRIDVLGDRVAVTGGVVDASGAAGGGRVRVGGGLAGDPSVPAARVTRVGGDATLRASATDDGAGGEVIVWSETATAFEGRLEAVGAGAGDGGFAELSSRGRLQVTGTADLSAPGGAAGTLLLDPLNLRIVDGGAETDLVGATGDDGNADLYAFAEDAAADSALDADVITAILDGGTSVTLQALNDLSVEEAVDSAGATVAGGGLTLQAGNDVRVDAPITLANGDLVLSANDPLGTQSGSGAVRVNAAIDTGTGALEILQHGSSSAAQLAAPIAGGALTVAGDAALSADVVTAGAQNWNGALSLGADVALTAVDAPITLQAVDGAATLALDAGTGTVRLEGPVGAGTPLGAVAVNGTGDLELLDAFAADALLVPDAATLTLGGTLALGAGGGSLTADTLSVGEAVTSTGALALTATAGALAIAAGADVDAAGGLALAGSGGIDLAADLATAGGALTVADPLRLGDSVTLATAGGDLTLDAVTGNGFDLALVSGAGTTRVTGALDDVATLALQADDASSTGAVLFEDAVTATALTTFARPHDLAFTGATTRFADPVTVRTTGTLTLGDGGDVLDFDGGLDATAPATRLAGTVRSAGTDLTVGALNLDGDGALATGGGALRLDGPVDGAFALGLDAGAG
ncbi:MAG: filamentous hemagglutinin N-terminal domain-containing protein, partial [Pseudomonadales bacterium]|nr:filamentous hemagglutinin N-terminal domain-containing protein [Pseudomonadales bacterium]